MSLSFRVTATVARLGYPFRAMTPPSPLPVAVLAAALALAPVAPSASAPVLRLRGGALRTPCGTPVAAGARANTVAPLSAHAEGGPPPTIDGRWEELAPPPRLGAAVAYDSKRGRWLLYGGLPGYDISGEVYSNETWEFDPRVDVQWRRIDVPGARPPGTAGHRAVYDSTHDRLLVFGGAQAVLDGDGFAHFEYYRDVWALTLEGPPLWTPLEASGGPAAGRSLPGVAYDAAQDRLLVCGGFSGDVAPADPDEPGTSYADLWAFSLATDTWTLLDDGAHGPAPRYECLLALDATGARCLLVGGEVTTRDSSRLVRIVNRFDVWARPLDGSAGWSSLAAAGTPPDDRAALAAAWDAADRRAFVTGGYAPDPQFDPTALWTLDAGAAPRWAKAPVTGDRPAAREFATSLVDPRGGRFVLCGGDDGASGLTDAWSMPLVAPVAWRHEDPPSELGSPRDGLCAAFDAIGRREIVFGGVSGGNHPASTRVFFDDLRTFDVGRETWSAIDAAGPRPTPRAEGVTVFDSAAQRLWIVGGESSTGDAASELWSLDLRPSPRWTDRSQLPGGPWPLEDGVAVEDPVARRLVLFARPFGAAAPGVWMLGNDAPSAWQSIATTGAPAPEHGGAAIYDARRRRMVVFGGFGGSFVRGSSGVDALALDGPAAWTNLDAVGDIPPAVFGAFAVYDSAGDRMLMFGGETAGAQPGQVMSTAYELRFSDAGPSTWRALRLRGGTPQPRAWASGGFDAYRGAMYVFSGTDGYKFPTPDAWRLALTRPTIEVALDVWPGAASDARPVGARAPLPVALLSGATFDPGRVDAASLRLNGVPSLLRAPRAVGRATRDWNGDGVPDRLAWFDAALVRAGAIAGQVELTGALTDGTPIHGVASLDLRSEARAATNGGPAAAAPTLAVPRVARAGDGGATLAFRSCAAGAFEAELVDARGRRVAFARGEALAAEAMRVALVPTAGRLAPGVYFARLRQGAAMVTARVVLLP